MTKPTHPNCLEILKLVAKYHYLTINQIRVLSGIAKYRDAQKAVFEIWRNYFLERLILTKAKAHISFCYVFGLSLKAARQLKQETGCEQVFYLKPKAQRSSLFLEHTILINNFRICLEKIAEKRDDFELVFWKQEKNEVKVHLQ